MTPKNLPTSSDAEYNALRKELLEYSGRIVALNKFTLVSSFAILGFAVSAKTLGWFIALLPIVVVFAASELILNHKFQIARIAAYIRVVYTNSFPYERYMFLFRQNWRHGHPSFEASILLVATGIVLASIGMSVILGVSDARQPWSIIVGLALFISLWLLVRLSLASRRLKLGGRRDEEMERLWLDLIESSVSGKAASLGIDETSAEDA